MAISHSRPAFVGIGAVIGIVNGLVGPVLVIRYLSSSFAMSVAVHPSPIQVLAALSLCAATVTVATLVALRCAGPWPRR